MTTRLVALALLAAALYTAIVHAQQVPLATEADRVLSQLEVSRDGKTVRFRSSAPDSLRVCVTPREFGQERCTTLGAWRRERKDEQ